MNTEELYTEMIIELYKNPVNYGNLEHKTVHLEGGNPGCGDVVGFDVLIEEEKIKDITFHGKGCAISTASNSLITTMAKGKTIEEILTITNQDVFKALGNIIQNRVKCALLSLTVLQKGIGQWQKTQEKEITQLTI